MKWNVYAKIDLGLCSIDRTY